MGDATVGTVTVLFTDLVDSTKLLQRGAARADELRRTHFDDVRRAIDAHRGVEIKNTGDGIMATFASATDAAAAATTVQQTVDSRRRADPGTPEVRVGIATGEATHEDGDWFGAPVILAARLCAVAEPGGILVDSIVPALVGARGNHRFEPRGMQHLKGFEEPTAVAELVWDRWVVPDLPAPALAARSAGSTEFVGRSQELDQLKDAWKESQGGRQVVALVGGEPGVGKSRLLGELADHVHCSEGRVLWGRCDDGTVVPYQPWVEVLRQAVQSDVTRAALDHHEGLDLLLPELDDTDSIRRPRIQTLGRDLERERLQLFDVILRVITDLSRDAPLLIVLDDVHWAARPTLLLLRHVIREQTDGGLLMVAAYRDTEVDRRHPLADLLADLRRDDGVRRLAMTGLDEASVLELVRSTLGDDASGAGHPGSAEDDSPDVSADQATSGGPGDAAAADRSEALAQAVHRETRGNPFFVGQVLSHIGELGALTSDTSGGVLADLAELGVPDGVREVVGRRLARLSDDANRALVVAAIVGAQFDLATLEAVPDAADDPDRLLDALDESIAARLVEEVPGVPGRYVFVHALVRQTLLANLSATRRARLHHHVADALSRRPGEDPAVLAEHYCACATTGSVSEALHWSAIAADAAIEALASEQAIVLVERALALSEMDPAPDRRARAILWLLLASAQQWIGETRASKDAADRAAEEARAAGDAVLFAEAAAQRAGWAIAGAFDRHAGDLVTEAIEWLADDRPDLRSRLLSSLALHRSVSEAQGLDAAPLADEAIELARQVGDPELLAWTIGTTVLMHTAGSDVTAQRAMVHELQSLYPRIRDKRARLNAEATLLRMAVVLDMQEGEPLQSRESFAAADFLVTSMLSMWEGMHELFTGRLTDAERANEALAPFIERDVNTANSWAAQLFRIRREQGRAGQLSPVIADAIERTPGLVGLRAMYALALVDGGQLDAARSILDDLAPNGFAAIPSDSVLSSSLADLTEVAARVGDEAALLALHHRLEPFAGQLLVVSWGVACLGAADRHLAMLETRLGRYDAAEANLASALALEVHAGGRPAAARTRLWWAELLVQRGEAGDLARARDLLAAAVREADELGMAGVAARAHELIGVART
jgi:class 3 adenylate cyclase